MAYTTPTPYWETSASPPDSHTAAKEFATFLNGRHATQPNGAVWKIIDCYDGTTREQPTNGDSANLSASNKWREDQGVPPQNAWIVWQAPAGGDVAARFQVYMEMTTFTSVFFGMFMLNDWSVGAGTDSNPDIPATSLGAPAFAGGVDLTISNHTNYTWRAVVDEGTIILGAYPTVSGFPEFFYIGDLKAENDVSLDPRPFVISKNPDASGWNGEYFHVAISDDTTIISTRDDTAMERAFADADDQDTGWTTRAICEVGCYGNDAGDRYRKGKFRLCAAISRHARTVGVERISCGVGPTSFAYEVSGRGGTAAPLLVTRYGKGTALASHIELVARTIPKVLEPGS